MPDRPICRTAEEVTHRWGEAAMAGDLEGLVALYEPTAQVYNSIIGGVAAGTDAIREALAGVVAQMTFLDFRVPDTPLTTAGDYAFVHRTLGARVRDAATQAESDLEFQVTEVFHRGADGGWRYIIDHH